jgi:hypothetical protein
MRYEKTRGFKSTVHQVFRFVSLSSIVLKAVLLGRPVTTGPEDLLARSSESNGASTISSGKDNLRQTSPLRALKKNTLL